MKRASQIFAFFLLIVVFTIGAGNISAQSFRATIQGKVTDAAGATVPGAVVTATQQGTNATQTVTTSDDGEYVFAQLQPGTYALKIEAPNFKTAINSEVTVETDQNLRFDISLEAGNVSEVVTVEDTPSIINTETQEKAEVITQRQVQDLPLNGRNFTDLALLVPGVYPRPNEDDQGQGVAASGSRTDSTNFILDGTTNRSDRNGAVGVNTGLDSIREFKVSTSNYAAEYGKVGGAQINVVSKSGTNRFSGTLFEYVRNDAFDAIDVFSSPEEGKTLRRHQFGGTVGGPLPFFNFGEGGPVFESGKDKTFFFVSYERTLQTRSQSAQSTAPNADWLRGDFRNLRGNGTNTAACVPGSAVNTTATNPCNDDTNRVTCLSRNPTTGAVTKVECPVLNVIPLTVNPLFPNILPANPLSLEILKRLPAANVPGSLTQYRTTLPSENNNNQFSTKIDRTINDQNSFFVRYSQESGDSIDPFPSARNFYPGFGRTGNSNSKSFAFSDTHIFTPRLVNEFRLGYLYQHNETLGENSDVDYVSLFGIPGLPTSSSPNLQGYPAIRIDGFSEFGDRPNDPFVYTFRNFQIYDSVNAIFGNHNVKAGVDILRPNYVEADVRNVRGDFRFRGRNTAPGGGTVSGYGSFADFLYGLPDSTQRQIGAEPADLRGWQYSFFLQDNWRVASWLTLNLGVRYDLAAPLTEKNNRLSNYLPELRQSVCAGGEVRENGVLICRSADELGLPASLVRADKNNIAPRFGFAIRPFNDDKTVIRGGAGIFYSVETINPARQQLALNYPYIFRETYSRLSTNLTLLSFQNPFPATRGELQGVAEPQGIPTDSKVPEIYQYNLTLERELVKDLALEIGYVGTQAHFLGLRYNLNGTYPVGVNQTTGVIITARPNPAFGDIQYQVQEANSYYHGLQTSLRRRARNGLTMLVSYTFSKTMDMNSNTNNSTTGVQRNPQNVRNFRAEYALSDFHRTHQFSASFNYDLPFGKGRTFFSDANGLANAFLGGWQLNGIVTHLSGRPFTPQFAAPDVTQQRPDLIGDPYSNIPEGFFFNPYAFARPQGQEGDAFGNAGRNILIGPAYNRTDLSLFKNFRVNETTRLQFRWEVFNVFNEANYRLPTFLLPNNISAFTTGIGATATTAPAITLDELRRTTNVGRPTELATPMREMQFAVRLIF